MNIFESLESLNVSEDCFNDIIEVVEEILSEEFEDMEDRVDALAPNNKELQKKAANFEMNRIKNKRRVHLEGTPKEKAEKKRRYESVKEIRRMAGLNPYRVERPNVGHPATSFPDYQHVKKIAKDALKKVNKNTCDIKFAKKGDSEALYDLGKKIQRSHL